MSGDSPKRKTRKVEDTLTPESLSANFSKAQKSNITDTVILSKQKKQSNFKFFEK